MPVTTYYPSTFMTMQNGANFINPTNLYANDGTYMTVTQTAKNTTSIIRLSVFGINIPSGSIINSVVIETKRKMSTTASAQSVALQAYYNSNPVGTRVVSTAEPLVDTVFQNTSTGTWTADDLNYMVVMLENIRTNSTQPCTVSYDYVAVIVDYTETSFDKSITVIDINGDVGLSNGIKTAKASPSIVSEGDVNSSQGYKYSVTGNMLDTIGFVSEIVYIATIPIRKTIGAIDESGLQSNLLIVKSGRSPPVIDSIGTTEAVSLAKTINRPMVESCGSIQLISTNKTTNDNVLDSVGSVQSLSIAKAITVGSDDSIGFILNSNVAKTVSNISNESIGFNQTSSDVKYTSINVESINGTIDNVTVTQQVIEIERKSISVIYSSGFNENLKFQKNIDLIVGQSLQADGQIIRTKRVPIDVIYGIGTQELFIADDTHLADLIDSIGMNENLIVTEYEIENKSVDVISSIGFEEELVDVKNAKNNIHGSIGVQEGNGKTPFKFSNIQDRVGIILISHGFSGQPYRIKSKPNMFVVKDKHNSFTVTDNRMHSLIVVNKGTVIRDVTRDDKA